MPAPKHQPEPPDETASFRFDDPRSIRALAHPARLAIIDALAKGEELTATQCAQLTGLSPSATAYHLKSLEQYGYAEPAPPRPDRRERPWRAARRPVQAYLDNSTPANAAATAAFVASYIDTTRAVAVDFVNAGPEEPQEWRDASLVSSSDWWLTVEEALEVAEGFKAVLERFGERGRSGERPAGARRVRIMHVLSPHRSLAPGEGPETDESRRRTGGSRTTASG